MVLVHSAAGYRDQNEGWQASTLRQAGFATLTYDSFAAHGMDNLVSTSVRGPPPYPSAIADAFAALARDPRIDPGRVAILGFSFGGEVAHDTAFERLRTTLGDRDLALLIDGEERPFDDKLFESCIVGSLGYIMGYDAATRTQSTAEAIRFLKRNLAR